MDDNKIAAICHEANASYCKTIGEPAQSDWEHAANWQRSSAIAGVKFHRANPDASLSTSHECWLEQKHKDGWKYGLIKDEDKKEHPCIVSYDELPEKQRRKDALFKAIVTALTQEV